MSPTSPITRPAASHATSTPFETVADEVFRRYGRVWKSATLKVNRVYLRNQIMPWFAGRPVADITRAEVRRWFGTLRATPAAANRSLPILSVIMPRGRRLRPQNRGNQPVQGDTALPGAAEGTLPDIRRAAPPGPGARGRRVQSTSPERDQSGFWR